MNTDWLRTIETVEAGDGGCLALRWSDGTAAQVALPASLLAALDGTDLATVRVGDWGHGVEWPGGVEIGADSLWLLTLTATGRDDARQFMEWRLANGLSLSRAAEELGLSRRMVAYYSNGQRPVPKAILLACKGWDATHPVPKAA